MAATVPPTGDQPFLSWAQVFDAKINIAPTLYGLIASQATVFHGLVQDLSARMLTANDPATRTSISVAAKNTSKSATLAKARQYVAIVNSCPTVTPAQRADLGLNQRDFEPTPIPPPVTRPQIAFRGSMSQIAYLGIVDETTPTRRAKPFGVIGCELWVKIGGPAPTGIEECDYIKMATRGYVNIPLPPGSANQTCYIIGRWINERGEPGPAGAVSSGTVAA